MYDDLDWEYKLDSGDCFCCFGDPALVMRLWSSLTERGYPRTEEEELMDDRSCASLAAIIPWQAARPHTIVGASWALLGARVGRVARPSQFGVWAWIAQTCSDWVLEVDLARGREVK